MKRHLNTRLLQAISFALILFCAMPAAARNWLFKNGKSNY